MISGFSHESWRPTQLPNDGGELADLQGDARVVEEQRVAETILVEPHGRGVLARIEAAIGAQLDEARQMVAEPTVEKEPQSRIGEVVVAAEDETGSLLVEPVSLHVEQPGELKLRPTVRAGPAQPLAELVEDLRLRARCRSDEDEEEGREASESHEVEDEGSRTRNAGVAPLNPLSVRPGSGSLGISPTIRERVVSSTRISIGPAVEHRREAKFTRSPSTV